MKNKILLITLLLLLVSCFQGTNTNNLIIDDIDNKEKLDYLDNLYESESNDTTKDITKDMTAREKIDLIFNDRDNHNYEEGKVLEEAVKIKEMNVIEYKEEELRRLEIEKNILEDEFIR